jgi:MarR family transcriptional regulator, organic hydroperoxide resistance regulator
MKRLARSSRPKARASHSGSRSLEGVLGFMQLLWAVAQGLEASSMRMRATIGVTGPQRLVVRLVGHFGHPSPGDLADVLHVHPSSLTGVMRRLERAGLIRRTRDPKDGRRAILALTRRGRALNDRRAGTVEASVQRTLDAFSQGKAASAREVLKTLAEELGVGGASTPPRTRPRR